MIPPELAPAIEKSTVWVCVTLIILSGLKTLRWWITKTNGG